MKIVSLSGKSVTTGVPQTLPFTLGETGRGRETEADIAARLRREVPDPPPGVATSTVFNDADRETGIARFLACLRAG